MTSQYTTFPTLSDRQSGKADVTGMVPFLFWILFLANVVFALVNFPNIPEWRWGDLFRTNGFTLLLFTTVSFFSAIISTYAKSYFKERGQRSKFMVLCLAFTFAVLFFIISEHLLLLLLGWLLMGLVMSRLIGFHADWGEAKEAKKLSRNYFLVGSFLLGVGLLVPAAYHNSITLSAWTDAIGETPKYIMLLSTFCIITAALIQSAIFPFHKWLLSSMTAPTPASALMHAGFVNGSGIILTLLAPILIASNTLDVLLIIGGLTAIIAQFTKLIQVNVKQRLACSTIAQMGFMIMQCGLGFFSAAIAHLILHGFYKASLFLSSGEEVEKLHPKAPPSIRIKWYQGLIVLVFSLMGAYLFALLTGKGMAWDSGIFLTLIAAIAVGQMTYNLVKQNPLNGWQKIVLPPVLFISGIAVYALVYTTVTTFMNGMEVIAAPTSISPFQMAFGIVFLIGFFIMKLGSYRKIPWLYVRLLSLSQPAKKTFLSFKN
ncbi:proton-conducting transporter transmembrane domain-containing protein [Maribacter flavus]|uniref:Pesticidal protein Cry28Aa n=1 Tax=Maribacter flavus TaxID=1658664 RepID=A0A5B2TWM3_9FLAO|nr:proton-conducting transporter membrane subunit [Maribacter flavus]KAA2218368.1 pesticidal protein Cry28Aa [Maribacter flavus]